MFIILTHELSYLERQLRVSSGASHRIETTATRTLYLKKKAMNCLKLIKEFDATRDQTTYFVQQRYHSICQALSAKCMVPTPGETIVYIIKIIKNPH